MTAAALFLAACGAPAGSGAEPGASSAEETPAVREQPEAVPDSRSMLPALDVSGLEKTMPEADYGAFQAYLPVLTGEETFCWVAGPYDGGFYDDDEWEPFEADLADVYDRYWGDSEPEKQPAALTLDRLAVADIVGDDEPELVLFLQDGASNYLILHREDGEIYGTTFYVRWLMDLQKNGIYMGSGGADIHTYYRLSFHDGRFWGEELGEKIGDCCELAGQAVSEADFDVWYRENMTNGVAWYAPDGSVMG